MQSRRKHQITQQSIRQGGVSKPLLGAISVLSICLFAFILGQALVAQENPLDHLRNRSAENRWKSIRKRASERREERRERAGKRKSEPEHTEADELPESEKIPLREKTAKLKSVISSKVPFLDFGSIYQERFQLDQHQFRENPQPSNSVDLPQSKDQKQVNSIDLPMPAAQPVSLPVSTQPKKLSGIQAIPISDVKSVKIAFTPDLPMPAPVQDLKNLETDLSEMRTPEEVENSLKAQGLYGQFDKIKPVQSISPFVDYEPDQKLRKVDPGRHLCFLKAVRPGLISNAEVQCPGIESLPGSDIPPARNFANLDYSWKASNVHSNPLYFEDPNLERYGHIHRPLIQPVASIARFNLQLLGLPYQMAMQPVSKCVYPLGHFRPGDINAPKYYYQIPLNPWAALLTAEVYTGLFFIIP